MPTQNYPLFRSDDLNTTTVKHYTLRAADYDTANTGWHAVLARDFVAWCPPPAGGAALDLACGTGLVTFPLAAAARPAGVVIGLDLTRSMLDVARAKPPPPGPGAPITFAEADISDLSAQPDVQDVLSSRGGFDVITCCSASVLLPDLAGAIAHWTTLLKPGGRLIVDVPTKHRALMLLFSDVLVQAVGEKPIYPRAWVRGPESLEKLFVDAGLSVEKTITTDSYVRETWYGRDDGMRVFDERVAAGGFGEFQRMGKLEEARKAWPRVWEESLDEEGRLWDGHRLYVTIGRKEQND